MPKWESREQIKEFEQEYKDVSLWTKKEKNVKKTPSTFKRSFAAGLGYSSDGSFFFDLAVRGTRNPVEYIYPYSDYIFDNNNNVISLTPEIRNKQMMWDVVATLGFRF